MFPPKLEQVYGPIICFKNSFVQKCSLEKEKRSFYKFDAIFSPQARRNFVNLQFFSMKIFFLKCSSGNVEFDFDNFPEKFYRTSKMFLHLHFFSNWKFWPKMFLGKKRMQDCQTCWKIFSRSAKKNYAPIVFLKQLCSP